METITNTKRRNMNDIDVDDPLLSRAATTSPFGKNDRRLDIPVSEELENAVISLATLRGMTKAEFARSVIEKALFGEFSMVQRIATRGQ